MSAKVEAVTDGGDTPASVESSGVKANAAHRAAVSGEIDSDVLGVLTTAWEVRGLTAAGLELRTDGTLVASDRRLAGASAGGDAGALGALTLSREPLSVGALLGRGGMGEVREATQHGLRRTVAIKRAIATDDGATSALLKEAWVGAHLEHPNVVPIHLLAEVEERPAVVMKYVDGVSWTELIADPAHPRMAEVAEPLAFHLRVLIAVSNAVAFAHSRGVLHLDLKPDNVMLGRFGEVYVVDWGLAAGIGDEAPAWLRPASAIRRVAGTPGYMAPEVAMADSERIDERTDVYLLGGMLHHVLRGAPLHRASTVMEVLALACASRPHPYGDDVPAGLAAIVHRATERDPTRRPGSAAAFRDMLEAFLRDQRVDRLLRVAEEGLAQLETLDDDARGGALAAERIAEVEVGLEQVRRLRAGHARLASLERRLLRQAFEHALSGGRPDDAEACFARMSDPGPALTARVTALRQRLDARRRYVRSLEELSRELDLTLGNAVRQRLFLGLAVAWAAVCVLYGWVDRTGLYHLTYPDLLLEGVALLSVLGPLGYVLRHSIFKNRANRRLYAGLITTAAAVELFWLAAWIRDLSVSTAVGITLWFYTYCFGALAIVLDRRFALGTVMLGVAALFASQQPAYVHEAVGIGGALAVLATVLAWRRTPKPER